MLDRLVPGKTKVAAFHKMLLDQVRNVLVAPVRFLQFAWPGRASHAGLQPSLPLGIFLCVAWLCQMFCSFLLGIHLEPNQSIVGLESQPLIWKMEKGP